MYSEIQVRADDRSPPVRDRDRGGRAGGIVSRRGRGSLDNGAVVVELHGCPKILAERVRVLPFWPGYPHAWTRCPFNDVISKLGRQRDRIESGSRDGLDECG